MLGVVAADARTDGREERREAQAEARAEARAEAWSEARCLPPWAEEAWEARRDLRRLAGRVSRETEEGVQRYFAAQVQEARAVLQSAGRGEERRLAFSDFVSLFAC
jgi:hypothetical protein